MPTICISLVQPLVTPSTAFETSARVSPCRAASDSFSRTANRLPSLVSSVMPAGTMAVNLPLGPSTSTLLPCILYFTVVGNGIGFLPIRDILFSTLHGLRVAAAVSATVPLQPLLTRLRRESRRRRLRAAPAGRASPRE